MSEFKIDLSAINGISVYKQLGDFEGTLKELKANVEKLIVEHGEDSVVSFDAGHNNIDCKLVTVEMIKDYEHELAVYGARKLAEKDESERQQWERLNKKFGNDVSLGSDLQTK